MLDQAFGFVQRVGKALMLPVSVLPVAGLLLGIGASQIPFLPPALSNVMAVSGGAIFANLPLLFAIAVALGFTASESVSALAATIGYVVMRATMEALSPVLGVPAPAVAGAPALDTGVFGGILTGAMAAFAFNRYSQVRLPPYLGFFAGKRFVPIVTAVMAIALGAVLSVLWPGVQGAIGRFSHWAAVSDIRTAASLYGFVERLLIPFGLHHIWNVPFFFEIGSFTDASGRVVHGDVARFFAGDGSAGVLAGAFFFKMFGLPGAALAMWRSARPQHRRRVGAVMVSAALTSFLTGITEPIEFAFLFAAPGLYLLHAVLAGSCHFLANTLDMHLGFTFSQGAIDFAAFNLLGPTAHRAWLVPVLGPLYGVAYFGIFRFAIERFDLKTPGRDEDPAPAPAEAVGEAERSRELVGAFGGEVNITSLDACITRLRISVKDPSQIDTEQLKRLGASAVLVVGSGVQAIFGPDSENIKSDLQEYLKSKGPEAEGFPARSPREAPGRARAPQHLQVVPPLPPTPTLAAEVRRATRDRGRAPAGPLAGLKVAAELARIAQDHGTLAEDLAQARQRERVLERNLEQGKHLAGLGGVVAGVAHDLRTPITGIKLTLDGLARRSLDERSESDVATCLEELARLDRLVGSLMVVARSGSDGQAEVDLAELVAARLRRARQAAEERQVRLTCEGTARVPCHPDLVLRVVDNLVNNALEATPEGGEIHVAIEADETEARILVADSGPGVPPERESELFEPFFTLKPQGTGLGLFLSRNLVAAQGGRLDYARHGQSTVFTVALPRERRAAS